MPHQSYEAYVSVFKPGSSFVIFQECLLAFVSNDEKPASAVSRVRRLLRPAQHPAQVTDWLPA